MPIFRIAPRTLRAKDAELRFTSRTATKIVERSLQNIADKAQLFKAHR
jgi:hypothetical protein